MFDKFAEIQRLQQKGRQERLYTYREKSKQALKDLIRRRCTTIFIGNLDSIEQRLGYQWGSGKRPEDLSEREILFLQLWKELRKEILDKSNLQTKIALREIDLFTVELLDNYIGDNDE